MTIASPNMGLVIFVIITLIYSVLEYVLKGKYDVVAFIIYIILLLTSQFVINIGLTKTLCGETHVKTAFIYTLIPWVLIFGMLNLMLVMFPGWLRPFSNTIGYFIINLVGGLNNLLGNILKSKENTENKELTQTLGKIYDNPSLLINEIPNPSFGFDDFWDKLRAGKLLASGAGKYEEQLKDLVRLKFVISKFIWFLLAGLLTVSTSYNYLIKSGCNTSVKEMVQRHNDYEKLVAEKTNNTVKNERVYKDTGK
jgi:hypothetical protein